MEKGNVRKWDIPFNETLVKSRIFSAVKINESTFAFGTVLNGLFVVNKKGEIIQHINKKK